jgi:hypothetical protein
MEILVQAAVEPLPSACAQRTDLPPALDAVIARATAKRPRDRVQTADRLLALLEDISA